MTYYIKYALKYSLIFQILIELKKKRINFFIDVQSIAKGFYNKDVILMEIGRYATDGRPSDIFIQEMRSFLNNLYFRYKSYDPFFVLFYDDGYCQQNKAIDATYKSGRLTLDLIVDNNEEVELFRQLKKYYFEKMKDFFTKKDLSKVYYLREYETDFIPEYCIVNNEYDSSEPDVLNVILSTDKDLLQTCRFNNTIQCITSFKANQDRAKGGYEIQFDVFDNNNAVCYLSKKLKRGILTAEFIPMILAIAGDKADEIRGIKKGIGLVHAVNLLVNYSIPPDIHSLRNNLINMPDIIRDNFKIIEKNYKMTSFEEQLKRVPKHIFKDK